MTPKEKFSINGAFVQPHYADSGMFFRGSFSKGNDTNPDFIAGNLQDFFGSSIIRGVCTEERLFFEKTYNKRPPISYVFKKQQNLWVGNYWGLDSGGGMAACVLNESFGPSQLEEALRLMAPEILNFEEEGTRMVDELIRIGKIQSYIDPATKERMVCFPNPQNN